MQSFQNPWVSLGDGSIFYSNEVTLGDLETSEWVLKSFREDQSLTGNVELSVPLPILWAGERGLEIELMVDYAYMMKKPL